MVELFHDVYSFIFHVPANVGYPVLFALVAGESAGLWIPGETAILISGSLAAQGTLDIGAVIVIAATAAIVGDNLGYLIGRQGLRRILTGDGRLALRAQDQIARGEVFFAQHGGKTVFFGRFLPVLRVTASWLAGAHLMRWRRFFVFNAAGGIVWATAISLLGYLVGHSAEGPIGLLSGLVATAVVLAVAGHYALRRMSTRA
jgi:membrane protein DedA with SNARE-associated domain